MLATRFISCDEVKVLSPHTSESRTPLHHCNETLVLHSAHYNWAGIFQSCLIIGQRVGYFGPPCQYSSVYRHVALVVRVLRFCHALMT